MIYKVTIILRHPSKEQWQRWTRRRAAAAKPALTQHKGRRRKARSAAYISLEVGAQHKPGKPNPAGPRGVKKLCRQIGGVDKFLVDFQIILTNY